MNRNPHSPFEAGASRTLSEEGPVDVSSLPVSADWKTKFRLIAKAGGPSQKRLQDLSSGERFKVMFNFFAFLFGPLYYVAKGMWKRGLSLFAVCAAVIIPLGLLLDAFGYGRVADSLAYGVGAVFAMRANIDHYKKWVLQDNGWW